MVSVCLAVCFFFLVVFGSCSVYACVFVLLIVFLIAHSVRG